MSRIIKFRAWDKKRKEFFEILHICQNESGIFAVLGSHDGKSDTPYFIDDIILMQFTGLKDKNGKEIYFDDLVKAPSGGIFQVIWHEEEMRIALKQDNVIYNFNVPLYEVIGNIWENKNLLERA